MYWYDAIFIWNLIVFPLTVMCVCPWPQKAQGLLGNRLIMVTLVGGEDHSGGTCWVQWGHYRKKTTQAVMES